MFIWIAIVIGAIGALPLLIAKRFVVAGIFTVIAIIIASFCFYLYTPALLWPLGGTYTVMVFVFWVIAAVLAFSIAESDYETNIPLSIAPPIILMVVALLVTIFGSSALFHAKEYAALIGEMEQREWTDTVQPKDPRHMRMGSSENAIQMASTTLGQLGPVGSRFEISGKHATIQRVNDHLQFIVPLDYSGFWSWYTAEGVPAYIIVDAENPYHDPKLVKLDQVMRFTPGAFGANNLERHLRTEGYLTSGLMEWSFEIDDDLREWWVVTVYHPVIAGGAVVVDGIVVVNPYDGTHQFYKIGDVPQWVDRVIPDDVIKDYLAYRGMYANGFWSSLATGTANITEPEDPKMIYSSEGEPEWVTSITSSSNKDASLLEMIYTNSRTGQSVRYHISGGGTDEAILKAVDNNQQVQFKHLHGVEPQIYNVYGHVAAVVPLLNQNHAYQGVAIVSVENIQVVAVGADQFEAVREFSKLMSGSGRQSSLDKTAELSKFVGQVERISSDISQGGTNYYLYLKGLPHIFRGEIKLSAKLPLTRPGDVVVIEYYASGEDVQPLYSFDNQALVVEGTKSAQDAKASEEADSDENLKKK